jgi:anti-sigma B factor antagonist
VRRTYSPAGPGHGGSSSKLCAVPEFKLDRRSDDEIALVGELDLASAPEVDALVDQPGFDGNAGITFDLTDLTFIDSQGIRAFIRVADAIADPGALVLRGASPPVRRVFDMLRLGDVRGVVIDG